MSEVLQQVQQDLKVATTRPLLDQITCTLQKLIADDLKLRSDELQMILIQKYPPTGVIRARNLSVESYHKECVQFKLTQFADLDRMYATTAAALHDSMSQQTPHGESNDYFATETLAKVESFKQALRGVPSGFKSYVPQKPDDLEKPDLPLHAEMSNIHTLLTRLKDM